ncbi:MAG: hypothetical protein MI923_11285 [Phycisphaerales bacterium]|nr:hypothetical protein [Phycisphaerales bacterium]
MNKRRAITFVHMLVVLITAAVITVAVVAIQIHLNRPAAEEVERLYEIHVGPGLGKYLRHHGFKLEDARRKFPLIQTYHSSGYTMAPVPGEYGKSTVSFTTLDGKMQVNENYDDAFIQELNPQERDALLGVSSK